MQTTTHTVIHICLDCGREAKFPGKTHASTERTCKLNTESAQPPGGFKPGTGCMGYFLKISKDMQLDYSMTKTAWINHSPENKRSTFLEIRF